MKAAVAAVEDSGDGPLNEELDEITKVCTKSSIYLYYWAPPSFSLQDADTRILASINSLVRDNVDVLTTSRSVEEGNFLVYCQNTVAARFIMR